MFQHVITHCTTGYITSCHTVQMSYSLWSAGNVFKIQHLFYWKQSFWMIITWCILVLHHHQKVFTVHKNKFILLTFTLKHKSIIQSTQFLFNLGCDSEYLSYTLQAFRHLPTLTGQHSW